MAVNRNLIRNSQSEETLSVVKHRPLALPKRPWTMMQRWNDLLFAHWDTAGPSAALGMTKERVALRSASGVS